MKARLRARYKTTEALVSVEAWEPEGEGESGERERALTELLLTARRVDGQALHLPLHPYHMCIALPSQGGRSCDLMCIQSQSS